MPTDLTRDVSCPACGWTFRRLDGAPGGGLQYVERYCRGCEEVKLIVLRDRDLVGVRRLYGRDRLGLRDTLRGLDELDPEARCAILRDALARARTPGLGDPVPPEDDS